MPLKKKVLSDSRLYLILDKTTCAPRESEKILNSALKGGIDIVQYRDKVSPTQTVIKDALPLFKVAKKYRVPFIINDRLDVALSIDADGIHLGQEDMPVKVARAVLGKDKIIGLSCHNASQVKRGQNKDLDYLAFGPIFKTATKPESRPRGLREFQKALSRTTLPLFGIGGISFDNLDKMRNIKKLRVAVCREICLAGDITETTKRLRNKIKNV